MASKTIKGGYDENPTAGNDPTKTYYFQSTDGTIDIELSKSQLAQILSTELGLITNPGDTSTFSMSIPNNTRNAVIAPVVADYIKWQIVADDATEPGIDDLTWTSGTVPAQYTVADWASHDYYLWIADNTIVSQVSTADGLGYITVQARSTVGPTPVSDFTIGTTDQTTAAFTFTETTTPDSAALTWDIIYGTNDTVIASDVSGTGTITGLTPNTTYSNVRVKGYVTDDPARFSLNVTSQTITTTAIGTITSFSVDNVVDSFNALISAFSVSDAAINQWIYQIGDPTKPDPSAAGWASLPTAGVDTITLPSLGQFTIYAWGRNSTYPTSITPVVSDASAATETGGGSGGIVQFAASTASYDEEGAPKTTITLYRSNSTSGACSVRVIASASTTKNPAVENYNFKPLDTLVQFNDTDATATFDLEILFDNLGYNSVYLDIALSEETSCTLGNNDSLEVEINGTYGYWSTSDIDIWNPPIDLAVSSPLTQTTGTISLVQIDDASGNAINANNASSLTIENVIIKRAGISGVRATLGANVTLRNSVILDCNTTNTANEGYALYAAGTNTSTTQAIKMLGCRSDGNAGGLRLDSCDDMSGFELRNNFDGIKRRVGSQGQLTIIANCDRMVSPAITGNKSLHYSTTIRNEDHYNFYKSGATSGGRGTIRNNIAYGTALNPYIGAGVGFIIGDHSNATHGYLDINYNTAIECGLSAYAAAGGRDFTIEYNDSYNPSTFAGVADRKTSGGSTNIGVYAWRVSQVTPGTFYNLTMRYNDIMYYTDRGAGPIISTSWWPSTGFDGLTPNHGPTAGGAEQTISNWSTNAYKTVWDNGGGENLVRNRKHVLTQPAIDDGIEIISASAGSSVGDGVLTYTQSTNSLTWAENGDSAGAAVDLSTPEKGSDERFYIASANGENIRVIVTSGSLPGSGVSSWTVKVTRFKLSDKITMYPGVTGKWVGESATTPTDTTAPTVPQNLAAASASATSIDLTWDQCTDATGVAGYYIYRDNVRTATVLGDPGSPAYTSTGLTEGTSYSFEVACFDAAGNVSARSQPASATPVNSSYVDSDEMDDETGWTASSGSRLCVLSMVDGLMQITSSVTNSVYAVQEFTGLSASTAYTLTVGHKGGYNQPSSLYRGGRVVIARSNAVTWSSADSEWMEDSGSISDNTAVTEHSISFTTNGSGAGSTSVFVLLWVTASDVGGKTDWDYVRIA